MHKMSIFKCKDGNKCDANINCIHRNNHIISHLPYFSELTGKIAKIFSVNICDNDCYSEEYCKLIDKNTVCERIGYLVLPTDKKGDPYIIFKKESSSMSLSNDPNILFKRLSTKPSLNFQFGGKI